MNFVYTAMNGAGQRITDNVDCPSLTDAQRSLADRGLFVLSLQPTKAQPAEAGRRARRGAAVQRSAALSRGLASLTANRGRDAALFARQMAMMLQAGAPVVPAIQAIADQSTTQQWRGVLSELSQAVEEGVSLEEAMGRHESYFDGTVGSLVAAGEATGTLPECFQRLTAMLDSQQKTKGKVISALIYPSLLLFMAVNVVVTMTMFVLPRFADLFKMLGTELPFITRWMLEVSSHVKEWWPAYVLLPVAVGVPLVLFVRSNRGRLFIGGIALAIPGIGRAVRGVYLAKFLRVWGMLLRSKVPVLESIRQSRGTTRLASFQRLFDQLIDAVTQGRSASSVLKHSRLVPPTIAATLATGEESGRMGECMEYVAGWLEEQNDSLINTLTRLFEPLILLVMGVIVGGVCIALFLPLFDIATAA